MSSSVLQFSKNLLMKLKKETSKNINSVKTRRLVYNVTILKSRVFLSSPRPREAFDKPTRHPAREIRTVSSKKELQSCGRQDVAA